MPSEIVEAVKESQWMKDGVEATTYWVTLVDGVGQREVPCYDPRGKDLKEDAPLPEGWEVKTSKAGKLYLAAPRTTTTGGRSASFGGSPQAAWRNTEAGAKYEQERMDRRTALMQAVAWRSVGAPDFLEWAEVFYAFLRESVSAPTEGSKTRNPGVAGTAPDQPGSGADTPSDGSGGTSYRTVAPQDSPPPSSSKRTANEPPPGWDQ
jgi:hypothetical protein